jgi:uncharacterized protein
MPKHRKSRSRSSKSSAVRPTKPASAKPAVKRSKPVVEERARLKNPQATDATLARTTKRHISNNLATMGSNDPMAPYARRLQLPKMPNGKQPGSGMAFDDAGGGGPFPYQGYLGPGLNSFNLYFPGYPYLAMLTQRSEYLQPTHTHAKDMTREWIEFTTKGKSDKSKKIEEIETRFEELNVQGLFRKALIHDGFYGVGHIFVDLKGHEDTRLPVMLDPKSIRKGQLRGFRSIEPMWVTPVMWNSAHVERESFYVPETWWALDKEMHKTRLRQVISREVPDILKPAYNFGGYSLSQLIEPYVDRWLKTVGGVNRFINNYSTLVLKTDMSSILEGGDGADLLKRLKMARAHGDNFGAYAVSADGGEELTWVQASLSGLAELQQQAVDHMAYPTHIPLVVLTGVTPSGLNASSDGEIEVYHDWNRSEQNAVVRSPLKYCLDVVQLDMYGKIDPDIGFKFKPIKQITGPARAEIKKTEAEQDVAYIDAGVVSAQEVREKVARDPESGFVNLDAEIMPELPDDEPEEIGGKPAGELVREAA